VIEIVDGFYVIQGTSAQAETVARAIPMGDEGAVELRPIMDRPGAPSPCR
jgi:hypothetical protein